MDPEASVIYEFAGRRLDPVRRQLELGGKPVALFPRCFDALLLLVERRGELLDKDFLLRALWPDVVVEENSLAKVISDIRRALGESRDGGCIETVPRRGYRFVAKVGVLRSAESTPVAMERPPGIRALAVLPLTFLNPAPGDETLSLGLADALITRFGQLRHTVVRPTSSITRYAGTSFVPTQVGRELGVDAVITGSIRRVGSTVRVSVQLVSVAVDAVSWAEKFDAEGSSTLALEDSIAERAVTALTLALARDAPPPPRRHRADPDAYEHYIRARYLIAKRTRPSLQEAIACLERAIAIDARFALAHAGLSEAWIHLGLRAAVSQSLRPRETMPKARAAAEKALALDEQLSEAHGTLGQVLVTYEWNRPAGIAELLRAIDLNPNNQNAQHWYAMALGGLGRFDEALAQIERALAIDPLAVIVNANVGYLLYRAGRIDEAIAKLRHTVAMEPGFVMTRYRLGLALEARGQYQDALAEFGAMQPSASDPLGLTGIARTRALMGEQDEARRLLAELQAIARTTYVPAATLADVHVALGEHDQAIRQLELAIEERAILAMWLPTERHWDPLRSHPRFPALLERVGLPEQGFRDSI
jgi:DNA-binding winged helix-turn-helix (wHTH) protein/tetratricopeptide (TPR) repeat protein